MRSMGSGTGIDICGIDWERAWHAYQDARTAPNDAAHWDRRSVTYGKYSGRTAADERHDVGEYERAFIERSGIEPGESVLDMGCGVGILAVPLAKMGCHVVCADFSEGMLGRLRERAEAAGVLDRIEIRKLAWDDDWREAGVAADSVDVAIASRSLATYNLTDALVKLDTTARRRVCATIAAGRSPMKDERAFEAVGRPRTPVADAAYVINILLAHGVFPDVSYIVTHGLPGFASHDDAFEKLSAMLGGDLTADEKGRLHAFLDEHYRVNPEADPSRAFESDRRREVRWAFIAWGE